ncbi:hypothetical protein OQA88_1089 [Cercophora sp. LCS_1]
MHELEALEAAMPPSQSWTLDGYPIVDGRYHDLSTGEIKTHTGASSSGPPSIFAHWHNRLMTGRTDQFLATSKVAPTRDLTEYMARIGDLLRKGVCKVDAINAMKYNVYVIVWTELSRDGFRAALYEHILL